MAVSAVVAITCFASGNTFAAEIIGFGVVVRVVMILALYQRRN